MYGVFETNRSIHPYQVLNRRGTEFSSTIAPFVICFSETSALARGRIIEQQNEISFFRQDLDRIVPLQVGFGEALISIASVRDHNCRISFSLHVSMRPNDETAHRIP